MQFTTGSTFLAGKIVVTFESEPSVSSISANTCGRQLTLATSIKDKEGFIAAMKAVVPDTSFTMI